MDVLSALGLFAALVPWLLILGLVWFLGGMPGRVAKKADHPDTAAIRIGGWASLVLGVVGYPWVLMWAYRKPHSANGNSTDLARLAERVADLERRLIKANTDSQEGADQ